MSDRTVQIVTGYHEFTPPNPAVDTVAGLPFRFAVVLDSYRADSASAIFDSELYCAAVGAVTKILNVDSLVISGECEACTSVGELESYYQTVAAEDREPPNWIRCLRNEKTVAVCASELWVRVGGPEPYHDGYTLSVFVPHDVGEALRKVCEDAVTACGGIIEGRYVVEE